MFLVSSINRVIPSSACRDLDGNHLTRRRSQRLFRAAYEQRRGAAGSRAIHSNHGTWARRSTPPRPPPAPRWPKKCSPAIALVRREGPDLTPHVS